MNPLQALENLQGAYQLFVETFQAIKNERISAWLKDRIHEGNFLWRPPYVTLQRRFIPGTPLQDLIDKGLLHPKTSEVFRIDLNDPKSGPIKPYKHQSEAWEILLGKKKNCVITTGTGSGKSFCFSIPVISTALWENETNPPPQGKPRTVKAVLVYPMNALANSQYNGLAERLKGSGLTVCNYTGDLKDGREAALSHFKELTGRAEPWDSEVISREDLRDGRGADILITNYVMLELILTRFYDRNIFPFESVSDLKYLVLDEIHTHTGRRGADVACLIRRLKEHTKTKGNLRCVGTSATVDSGSPEASRKAVAKFATDLFGEPFEEEDVVAESYGTYLTPETPDPIPATIPVTDSLIERATQGDESALKEMRDALCGKADSTKEDLTNQATVQYLEHTLIPDKEDNGRKVLSWEEVIDGYLEKHRPGMDREDAKTELGAALLAASSVKVLTREDQNYPLLLPKTHSFFSQGQPMSCCLHFDPDHLSSTGDRTCLSCADKTPSYPMVFCNACGEECLSAEIIGEGGIDHLVPSDFNNREPKGIPVYVFPEEWDSESVPPDENWLKKNGEPRSGREDYIPENHLVCSGCGALDNGCNHDDTKKVSRAIVKVPMMLCPSCGVLYDRRINEFNKFTLAGVVGRAAATDVLLPEMIQAVPADPKKRAIAFTDNVQDAAFQASHVTDMDRRLRYRRALLQSLISQGATDPETGKELTKTGIEVFKQLDQADVIPDLSAQAQTLYKKYLNFTGICELTGRHKRIHPSLEMVGLLGVTYAGIGELAKKDSHWASVGPLAEAGPEARIDVMHVILDMFRREGAIESNDFTSDFKVDVLNDSRIPDEYYFHDDALPRDRPAVISDEMQIDDFKFFVRRLAGAEHGNQSTSLVRWVRKVFGLDQHQGRDLVRQVYKILVSDHNGLKVLNEKQGGGGAKYAILPGHNILIYARSGEDGLICPRCNIRWEVSKPQPCPSCVKVDVKETEWGPHHFRLNYQLPVRDKVPILAKEHTGQVGGDDRRRFETDFENGSRPLNSLICTPTMELGIDIGNLSAVYMRNVPPSPANYAQRQGRAGRHGQPSIVSTFCGTYGRFGSHDRYFFRFPGEMISGKIAPPRFLLNNRVLLETHLHSLVLEIANINIPSKPSEFLNLNDQANRYPMVEDLKTEIGNRVHATKSQILSSARSAFAQELQDVGLGDDRVEELIDDFAEDFDRVFDAFRDEFQTLSEELSAIFQRMAQGDHTDEDQIRQNAILGRQTDMREGKGDFYPYRYLGTLGFLPNYAFPRRASSCYFLDRKDSIQRRQATALREFAPRSMIYRLGRRYRVERAQPRSRGQAQDWTHLKVCACGNFYIGADVQQSGSCHVCGTNLMAVPPFRRVLELPDVVSRRAGRISADEDERMRRGFNIRPYFKPGSQSHRGSASENGIKLFDLSYAHQGELLLVNHGARAENQQGFIYCQKCRTWLGGEDQANRHADENGRGRCPAGGTDQDIQREVILYVKGDHDFVFMDVDIPSGTNLQTFGWTLLYALSCGFQVAFSVDESEIGGHLFPISSDGSKCRILLYEVDEGGAGLMINLIEKDGWRRVARRALEILHVNPETGEEFEEKCEQACYDCLLSFFNQREHEFLDRKVVIPFLTKLLQADDPKFSETDIVLTWEHVKERAIGSEPVVVEMLESRGFPPPIAQHEVIHGPSGEPISEADLLYPNDIVVWIHGSVHEMEHVERKDEAQEKSLKSLGYRVVTIWAEDPGDGIRDLARRLDREDLVG